MEQSMWLPAEEEQVYQHLPPSKQNGVFSKIMIMGSSSLQHLTIRTCCLSTRRAATGRFMIPSDYPEITGTSWPALLIAARA